eukprot:2833452-Alexandrium_andersonii.AAC.1
MYRRVEAGALWPADVRCAFMAYVAKMPELSVDGTAYRGLAILSTVYRTWGKLRHHQLRYW